VAPHGTAPAPRPPAPPRPRRRGSRPAPPPAPPGRPTPAGPPGSGRASPRWSAAPAGATRSASRTHRSVQRVVDRASRPRGGTQLLGRLDGPVPVPRSVTGHRDRRGSRQAADRRLDGGTRHPPPCRRFCGCRCAAGEIPCPVQTHAARVRRAGQGTAVRRRVPRRSLCPRRLWACQPRCPAGDSGRRRRLVPSVSTRLRRARATRRHVAASCELVALSSGTIDSYRTTPNSGAADSIPRRDRLQRARPTES